MPHPGQPPSHLFVPLTPQVLEGNRLVLSPHTALDYVRPRPHVALIPPLVPHAEREPDPAFHAVYDVDPGLDLVLRRPPGHPGFDGAAGRDPPLPVPYGIDPRPAAYGGHVGHGLAAEDVPLTALAGFRRAPGGPDFETMVPREVPKPCAYMCSCVCVGVGVGVCGSVCVCVYVCV